jgi:hypothetical protein
MQKAVSRDAAHYLPNHATTSYINNHNVFSQTRGLIVIVAKQPLTLLSSSIRPRWPRILPRSLRPLIYWDCGSESPPPVASMPVSCECCAFSCRDVCARLIPCLKEPYPVVCVCVLLSVMRCINNPLHPQRAVRRKKRSATNSAADYAYFALCGGPISAPAYILFLCVVTADYSTSVVTSTEFYWLLGTQHVYSPADSHRNEFLRT